MDMLVISLMTNRLISLYTKERDAALGRRKILRLLYENKYGTMPEPPEHLRASLISRDNRFAAGGATLDEILLTVTVGGREFSFPINVAVPNGESRLPAFIHLSHYDGIVDKYSPAEEILAGGFALISFSPERAASGLKKLLGINRRALNSTGDICLWAWAAMRVAEYAATLRAVDCDKIAVIGHGHLGGAAMLAGAADERIRYTISNCSGIEGAEMASASRGGSATLKSAHPEWFCRRFVSTANEIDEAEAHLLTSAVAPRHLIIGTATDDAGLDAEGALLSAQAASAVYEKIYGARHGLVRIDRNYKRDDGCGKIAYYARGGSSYLSRNDWAVYMNYIKKKMS